MGLETLVSKGKQDVFLTNFTGNPEKRFWYEQKTQDEYVGVCGPITYEEWIDEKQKERYDELSTLSAVVTMVPPLFIFAPIVLPYALVRYKIDTLYFSFLRDYNEHWKNME